MKRFWRDHWKGAVIVAFFVGFIWNWEQIGAFLMFGYWPQSRVERLHDPVEVTGWTPDGLRLADGRTLQLPGFRKLPEHSVALARATERGVEIAPNGRVFGLMELKTTCGNDPYWTDIRRVDLGFLLEFLREGEYLRVPADTDPLPIKPGGVFDSDGWPKTEFGVYKSFVNGRH